MANKRKAFTLIELLVVVSIIALLLSILVPALSKAREQAKRAVCASGLRQIGLLLEFYCEDNNSYYPSPLSTNYPYGSFHGDHRVGILGLVPYLNNISDLRDAKSQVDMMHMSIFWCPSGVLQYDSFTWISTASANFGYNQYCRHSNFLGIIGEESFAARTLGIKDAHVPWKNTARPTWLTYADISISGYPNYNADLGDWWRSNHPATKKRLAGPSVWEEEHYAAGMNGLHVGGHVEWINTSGSFESLIRMWMGGPVMGTNTKDPSYWLFPRTY